MGGKFHLKLNNGERPIANKYREGKMKRTLKRELKVLEIAKREALETSDMRHVNRSSAPLDACSSWSTLACAHRKGGWGFMISCQSRSIRIVGEGGEKGRRAVSVIVLSLYLGLDWGRNSAPLAAWVLRLYCLICSDSNAISGGKGHTGRRWFYVLSRSCTKWFHRPVLKHGPRSLTSMRVFGWKTLMRNESKGSLVLLR